MKRVAVSMAEAVMVGGGSDGVNIGSVGSEGSGGTNNGNG